MKAEKMLVKNLQWQLRSVLSMYRQIVRTKGAGPKRKSNFCEVSQLKLANQR